MPKETKPIKGRFEYQMNWKKSTFKIVDTHTGKTMTLREWDMLHLADLLPQFIVMFLKKKGKIKDMTGHEFTKEVVAAALKQDGKREPEKKDTFEAHPDSDGLESLAPKKPTSN